MKKFAWTKIRKQQALCLAAAVLMFAAAEAVQGQSGVLQEGNRVPRNGYGQGGETYSLVVDGLGEEELSLTFPVGEREYTEEEAARVFPRAFEELLAAVPGGNASLGEVRENLYFPASLDEYGIRVSWQSGNPQVVDSFGEVHNSQVAEDGQEVEISASLSSGAFRREYSFSVLVLPPLYTEEERRELAFLGYLEELDEGQRGSEFFSLPETFEGAPITYREERTTDNYVILLLGIAAAAAVAYREKDGEAKERKKRERQMLLDYSEIVSKLTVYMGAGMSAKGAWRLIAGEYEEAVRAGRRKIRYAYEEMCRTLYQMQSGMPEGRAYRLFGDRCGLRQYQKLAALLEQNMRTGTRGMRQLLEEEMALALVQRKDLAKRQGEEAGTKLLLPLFIMLGIVMVMIVVPAWMSFQF